MRWYFAIFLYVLCSTANGQSAQPLTPNERAAMDSIRKPSVQAAVSFLASDEMAGRQTPSPELRIASRYVASRLQAAGLEPLASDGTFFQISDFSVSQPPQPHPKIKLPDGTTAKCHGYLWGGSSVKTLKTKVIAAADLKSAESPRCVVLPELTVPPPARDQPSQALAALARRIRPFVLDGVELVIMTCEPTSVWFDLRRQLSEKRLPVRSKLQPGCAVILAPKQSEKSPWAGVEIVVEIQEQLKTDVPVRNVVAVLRGSDSTLAEEAVLVSAHLDHIGLRSNGSDKVNNGADDNASGVTAVLTLADAFTKLKPRPKRSIVFATFWGEEKGLLGSKAFVEKPLWPLKKIVANVNIEMVGRPEADAREKIWMTGWQHSNLGTMMNDGAQRIGVTVFDRKDVGEMLYTRSDNASFVRSGVVAHSFSAGSLHSDYHQPTDEWQKLDLPHMTKVIQGLFAGVLHIANGKVRPE